MKLSVVVADDMNLSVVAEARTRKTPTSPAVVSYAKINTKRKLGQAIIRGTIIHKMALLKLFIK